MRARGLLRLLAFVAAAAVLLGAGLAVLVGLPGGQAFLTQQLARALGGPGMTVAVTGVGGDWPSHIVWSGISVSDRDGAWLTLDRLELRLRPAALLTGKLVVESAAVGEARMSRAPAGDPAPSAPSPPPSVDGVAAALGRVVVRGARVDALRLDPPVLGRAIDAAVAASLQDDPARGLHTLALDARLRHAPGGIALTLAAGRAALALRVDGAAEGFTAAGAITVDRRTDALSGALKLNCAAAPCYAGPGGRVGSVAADFAVGGTLAAPEGRLDLHVRDIAAADRRLAALDGEITVRPQADAAAVAVAGAGTLTGVAGALPEAAPLLAEAGRWAFMLTRTPDGALTLDTASVASGDAAAAVTALALTPDLSPATLTLTLTGAGRMLGRADAASRTVATLRVDRLEAGGAGGGHLSVDVSGLPPGAALPPFVGGGLTFAADVNADARQVVLSNIALNSGMTVRGASTWTRSPAFDHRTSRLTVTLPPVGAAVPEPTQADVTLSGPLAALHADLHATAPAVRLSGAPLRDAILAATFDRTPDGFTAALDGSGQWVDGAILLSAGIAQRAPGTVEIDSLSWRSRTVDLAGRLTFGTDAGSLTGEIGGPVRDLAPLTEAFGLATAGNADVRVVLRPDGGQRLDATVTASGVENGVLAAERLTLDARLDDLWGDMALDARLEAAGARLLDRPLAAFAVQARGTAAALTVDLDAKGAADTPFSLAGTTDIALGTSTEIVVRTLAVRDGVLGASLAAPAHLSLGTDAVTLAPARIAVRNADLPPGEVTAGFRLDTARETFTGDIAVRAVALPVMTALPGQSTSIVLDGGAALSGPLASVGVTARLGGRLPRAKDQAPIDVAAALVMADGRARIDATATGLSADPARLAADIPARLDLAAARLALAADAPVSGSLTWSGALAPLWALVPIDVSVLAGDVSVDAALSGTLAAPVVTGGATLARGTYENLASGTALRNVAARIGSDGAGGFTLAMTAQDMNDGAMTVSGTVSGPIFGTVGGGAPMTADITADLTRLDVVHRDDVVAAATGRLAYNGPMAAGQLKGELQIVNSLVRLGGSYMPDIPLLRALPGFEDGAEDDLFSAVRLDIAVTTSNPMRIEGQGLDSMWRGRLNVAGSPALPDVRGTLTLDRGSFSFLSQTFMLDSGTVTFTGGGTIDPQLNIVAVRETSDVTATVAIAGRARAPEIQLSSRPAMPRDEILARLLFRKGTGELGPIESIQLASAASDLAGISQGGINGVLRRTFGLDLSSGSEGNSVMLGRQVGRNLYVSVGQSLTDQEREIMVEWRVSRFISLKSTTSDVTGADIGVFWRKDY